MCHLNISYRLSPQCSRAQGSFHYGFSVSICWSNAKLTISRRYFTKTILLMTSIKFVKQAYINGAGDDALHVGRMRHIPQLHTPVSPGNGQQVAHTAKHNEVIRWQQLWPPRHRSNRDSQECSWTILGIGNNDPVLRFNSGTNMGSFFSFTSGSTTLPHFPLQSIFCYS